MTNLVEPPRFSFMNDKRGSGPHDQTSEGKPDGHQEGEIGARLCIWQYHWVSRRNRRAKSRHRGKEQTSLDQT